ncbi:hypothetical protein ABIB90_007157 [Bradyrhizobium sp. JR4.1]|uniref:hypothetical protein n=1 Tax=Bradyrhizobium sp. JR4.1 TaxID=3156372 RepID=UPI0033988E1B
MSWKRCACSGIPKETLAPRGTLAANEQKAINTEATAIGESASETVTEARLYRKPLLMVA